MGELIASWAQPWNKQGQIKPETLLSFLSALRSYHIEHELPVQVFQSLRLKQLIRGGKSFFPSSKALRLPITKDILSKISTHSPINTNEINLDTAYKVAWAGFLRLGEITYEKSELPHDSFQALHLTRPDVSSSEFDQYVTLRLKRSKTDTQHTRVLVIIAATYEQTCPFAALRRLFNQDPRPSDAPLFCRSNTIAFSRRWAIDRLRHKLTSCGVSSLSYSGHSFRRGAAQHAADSGMLYEDIQKLGGWTSPAFLLYFASSSPTLYNLKRKFQTGRPVALPRTTA